MIHYSSFFSYVHNANVVVRRTSLNIEGNALWTLHFVSIMIVFALEYQMYVIVLYFDLYVFFHGIYLLWTHDACPLVDSHK